MRFRMTLTDLAERKAAEFQLTRFQQQLSAMAAESAMTAERERRRIAVEVHDTLSQSLVLAKMKLAGLIKKAAEAGVRDDVAKGLADVTHLVEEVLDQTRTLTFELSPPDPLRARLRAGPGVARRAHLPASRPRGCRGRRQAL